MMRPKTFVGVLGLLIAVVGGIVVDQATGGSGAALIPLVAGVILMAAAWLVRWPGDEKATAGKQARLDDLARRLARKLSR